LSPAGCVVRAWVRYGQCWEFTLVGWGFWKEISAKSEEEIMEILELTI
jgi:hypothetical protein